MCGLAGVYAFTQTGSSVLDLLPAAAVAIAHRGPDAEGIFRHKQVGLVHSRLSVIAPSVLANQPFTEANGRYTIILNGEIFNYQKLKQVLNEKGVHFTTASDTEVVLQLYLREGQEFLKKLRGFFALAIYDAADSSLFIARDRFGEKPLLYYKDAEKFLFGSELGALIALGVPRELDYTSLYQYLQLTYVPAPASILAGVKKLLPGHSLYIKNGRVVTSVWYRLPYDAVKASQNQLPYNQQQVKLKQLLYKAVADRLVSDVPVGAFLSGGIDSSIVTAIASEQVPGLQTFSVGFPDHPFFDETAYARLVAKKYNTRHTEVLLTANDLYDNLFGMLGSISEPFADSSALAVYALSRHVGQSFKVFLSGDGADELFGGYNKHLAEFRMLKGGVGATAVSQLEYLWKLLPKSRNSFVSNKVRQLHRFAEGTRLSPQERYWHWATWQHENEAMQLLEPNLRAAASNRLYFARKSRLLDCLNKNHHDLNNVLCADWQLVLANDMLPKIDLMGMANGLEIRSPYLDHRLVKFAFSLPASSKINKAGQKRILVDAFKEMLPHELLIRRKKGFEVPLQEFLATKGQELVQELLSDNLIKAQGIFNSEEVKLLRNSITQKQAGTHQTKLWSLLVFQYWWQKYMA
ncbi:asparagine synthase (glutamine-hydrolyzing) [Pontibacter cellulosilyticus]|uniref:asparagine synthase (glutamine-hydrolyzing) n=1 Tax=Pontibacter cellulosilyticus TaxID=1720253 RepID=A0A923N651_9BACT|nr:asparagine synthase (glutamine-hydrolyzing) [Pontibacter cellulosilyticus]MBC5993615.1 asparagine synthase (glutamine-hydrolyzing) [Pontibacter cellulosilyticus]